MKIKLCLVFIILALMMSLCVSAQSSTYTIDGEDIFPLPKTYEYDKTIFRINNAPKNVNSFLNNPSDLYIDSQENIFIADTGNNRVLKVTKNGDIISEYKSADGVSFSKPQGICVDNNQNIYIADTDNSRIVQLDPYGKFIKSYGKPESMYLSGIETYSPKKLGIKPDGGMYILMGENIMNIDSNNNFRSFIGQTKIGFDFLSWVLRHVASDEQKKVITKNIASNYENFMIDDTGLIYAVSRDEKEGQIKILNSVGNNIYRKLTISDNPNISQKIFNSIFSAKVISKPFAFGERTEDGKAPIFVDICVDKNHIISVLEKQSGKIYQYDQEGNLLDVFGGLGNNQGEFSIPSSIITDNQSNLYVLDSSNNSITIFKPTSFFYSVSNALTAYSNGKYEEATECWKEVMMMDQTYPLAHIGLAKTSMKAENYKAAMDGYKYVNDRMSYSKAFSEYRYSILKSNFSLVFFIAVSCFAVITTLFLLGYKYSQTVLYDFEYQTKTVLGFGKSLLLGVSTIFRPNRTFEAIKRGRGRLSIGSSVFVICATFISRVIFIYTVHYPFQDIELEKVNLILEFVKLIVPILTWVVALQLISSQFDGETNLVENFITMSYSMIPYTIVTLFAAFLSKVLALDEKTLFAVLVSGVWIWIIYMIIQSVKIMNDYSVGRTIFVCMLSLIAMFLIWFICIFGYSNFVSFFKFLQEVFWELTT